MQRLYLMRHGQTEYNVKKLVQGHCDSPLTAEGIEQARVTARWLAERGLEPGYLCSSPLGRAHATLDIVIEENPSFAAVLRADEPGLIERCYGTYEAGPQADMPITPWDPGDVMVPHGGDSEASARERMVETLTRAMDDHPGRDVLAVSHGSVTTLFKKTWAQYARCEQDVYLGNCCVLVFEYDPEGKTFANVEIANPNAQYPPAPHYAAQSAAPSSFPALRPR